MILATIQQTNLTPEQAEMMKRMVGAMFLLVPVFYLVGAFIKGLPYWFICRKAGFSPWLSLLFLIPLGGLVLSYVVGFAEWKVMPAMPPGWPPTTPYPPPPAAPPPPYPPYPPRPPQP